MNYEKENPSRRSVKNSQSHKERKLKVGDKVKVTRGHNQGVRATIIRETAAQHELKSDKITHTFRKWKNNVKKIKNKK